MRPARFQTAGGDLRSDIVLTDIDNKTGRATHIEHLQMKMEE
jgi:hypothetical protein